MRVLVFLLSIIYGLLISGQNTYTPSSSNAIHSVANEKISNNLKMKFIEEDLNITLIEDSDSDVEEDFLDGNQTHKIKTASSVYSLVNFYKDTFAFLLNPKNQRIDKSIKSFSQKGNSNPIYITQRVLRI